MKEKEHQSIEWKESWQDEYRYLRLEERQTQRAHSRAELRQWLKEAGFDEIRFYGRLRMTAPRPGDERWHVTARKAE